MHASDRAISLSPSARSHVSQLPNAGRSADPKGTWYLHYGRTGQRSGLTERYGSAPLQRVSSKHFCDAGFKRIGTRAVIQDAHLFVFCH